MNVCTRCVFESISASLTGSLSPGDQSLAQVADVEHGRGFNIVPVLLGERIHAGKDERISALRFNQT